MFPLQLFTCAMLIGAGLVIGVEAGACFLKMLKAFCEWIVDRWMAWRTK